MTAGKAAVSTYLAELRAAKAEFEHQLRRYGDAAERTGGILGASEDDVRRLKKNLADTNTEIARIERTLTDTDD